MDTEQSTALTERKEQRFVTGGKPGPGRPKGSRNKLADDFVADVYQHWQEHGKTAIARCAAEKPDVYLKVVAGLLPKDVNIKVTQLDDLSDEQLLNKLKALTEMARPLLARVVDPDPVADRLLAEPVDVEYIDTSKA